MLSSSPPPPPPYPGGHHHHLPPAPAAASAPASPRLMGKHERDQEEQKRRMSTLMDSIKDTIQFADDFDEFRARAASGGSLYGLFRRQAITQGILSGPPDVGRDGRPLYRRQRSRSLIPRSTALAEEKSILLALYDYAEAKRYQPPEPRRYSTAVDGRDVDLRRVLLAKSFNERLNAATSTTSPTAPAGGSLAAPGFSCNTLTVPGASCNQLTVPGSTCNLLTVPGSSYNTLTVPGSSCNTLTVPGGGGGAGGLSSSTSLSSLSSSSGGSPRLLTPSGSCNTLQVPGMSPLSPATPPPSLAIRPPTFGDTLPPGGGLGSPPGPWSGRPGPGLAVIIPPTPDEEDVAMDTTLSTDVTTTTTTTTNSGVCMDVPPPLHGIIRKNSSVPMDVPHPGSRKNSCLTIEVPGSRKNSCVSLDVPVPGSRKASVAFADQVSFAMDTTSTMSEGDLPDMSSLAMTEDDGLSIEVPPPPGPTLHIPTASISIPQPPGVQPPTPPPLSPGFGAGGFSFSPPSKERRASRFELMTTPPKITVTRKYSLPVINITDDNDQPVDADLDLLAPALPPPGGVPLQRRRSFTITAEGVKNEGDQILPTFPFMAPGMYDNADPFSFDPECDMSAVDDMVMDDDIMDGVPPGCPRSRTSSFTSVSTEGTDSGGAGCGEPPVYRILMLGGPEVGKTAITQQFMTSEYMAAQNTSFDDGMECCVPVLLDGEESIMEFIDLPYTGELGVWQEYDVDAHVVVFSITDRRSYQKAVDLVFDMKRVSEVNTAVIIVANKTDLVRSRVVFEEEASDVADLYDCKYIEVSAILNHKVDDLLVGVLKQIRLSLENPARATERRRMSLKEDLIHSGGGGGSSYGGYDGYDGCLSKARENVLGRLLLGSKRRVSKSCENLLAL